MNKNTGKVFDKDWFSKHQRVLVWLINSWFGKYVFQYRKMGHYPTNRIVGISPNSITEFIRFKGKRIELRQHFFSRNEYARKLYFVLFPMWWVMHGWDTLFANRFAPQLNFGFDTLTQYPGSIGANNPADGNLSKVTDNSTWTAIRDAATGTGVGTALLEINITCGTNNNTWAAIYRNIICFDTSALTTDAIISAAVLSLWGTEKGDWGTAITPDINVYTSTPANTNEIVVQDYDQVQAVAQCDTVITYANFSITGYNDFTFNATGRGNVSKTGISKFGARNANYDVADSAPTWSESSIHRMRAKSVGTDGTNKPKLVVTYTLPAVVGAAFLFNMI